MKIYTPEEEEKIVAQAEEARKVAQAEMDRIWASAEADEILGGLSAHQAGFWPAVEARAGEPYLLARASVHACYTDEVKRLLPGVRAARKAREQIIATAHHGKGYDNDSGSGYGANTND